MRNNDALSWWQIVIVATVIAALFAAASFWIVGLPLRIAEIVALVSFPAAFGFFFAALKGWT
jgi:hypothetical protein